MGFQGSMVIMHEGSKDYVVLSTNQSKKLLSGGQMSCNKDAAIFWTTSDDFVDDSVNDKEQKYSSEKVFGKDVNEWIREFVKHEFFHDRNTVNGLINKTKSMRDKVNPEITVSDNKDLDIEEVSIIDIQDNEEDEDITSKLAINDESKSSKTKKNFKVLKLMKNAIKKHIKN